MNSMMPIVATESDPISAFSPCADRCNDPNGTTPATIATQNLAESSLILGKRCDMQSLTDFACPGFVRGLRYRHLQ
jgi:hypothetical protein